MEYVDVLQLHWPDRYVPMFGDVDFDVERAFGDVVPLEEQLETVAGLIEDGKVRWLGLSNETPYGVMAAAALHKQDPRRFPRAVSIQNAYSLTCRTFDAGLAECCHYLEKASPHSAGGGRTPPAAIAPGPLLAYSPLAMGILTGKYRKTPQDFRAHGGPPGARLNRFRGRYAEAEGRYAASEALVRAVEAYAGIAAEAGLEGGLTELALRFVASHPMMASVVIGATEMEQLRENLRYLGRGGLERDILDEIDTVHALFPNPAP